MKKIAVFMAVVMGLTFAASAVRAANPDAGGIKGFLVGCCFGMRTSADYNENGTNGRDFVTWFLTGCLGGRTQIDYEKGKSVYWREIARIVPYVGVIFQIWDGVEGAQGRTRADYRQTLGASYF